MQKLFLVLVALVSTLAVACSSDSNGSSKSPGSSGSINSSNSQPTKGGEVKNAVATPVDSRTSDVSYGVGHHARLLCSQDTYGLAKDPVQYAALDAACQMALNQYGEPFYLWNIVILERTSSDAKVIVNVYKDTENRCGRVCYGVFNVFMNSKGEWTYSAALVAGLNFASMYDPPNVD